MATTVVNTTESYLKSLEMMSKGLSEALDTLAKIKEAKGRRLEEENVRRRLAEGPQAEWSETEQKMVTPPDTPQMRLARAAEAMAEVRPRPKARNIVIDILRGLNPNVPTFLETTPLQELVTRGMMTYDPMEEKYREAQIKNLEALAQQRETGEVDNSLRLGRLLQAKQNAVNLGDQATANAIQKQIDPLLGLNPGLASQVTAPVLAAGTLVPPAAVTPSAAPPTTQYKLGDIVRAKDGKQYKVVGFDTDGEPIVEEP